MISDARTGSWFRPTLIRFEQKILKESESMMLRPSPDGMLQRDPILEQFNSNARKLCGKGAGEAPETEMDLLEILDGEFDHLFSILQKPHSQEQVQAAIWLRDLASFPRLTPKTRYRSHTKNLIRLKLRLALKPRMLGTHLISPSLVIHS